MFWEEDHPGVGYHRGVSVQTRSRLYLFLSFASSNPGTALLLFPVSLLGAKYEVFFTVSTQYTMVYTCENGELACHDDSDLCSSCNRFGQKENTKFRLVHSAGSSPEATVIGSRADM